MKSKFEAWFQQQPFYLNLRFIHGDQLFTSENSIYRVLAVQIAWATWMEQQKRIEELESRLSGIADLNKINQMSECAHFSTTMFLDGRAACFHCDAVVNEKRQVIGRQQNKSLFDQARNKAEENIKNGARLTNHRINLGGDE